MYSTLGWGRVRKHLWIRQKETKCGIIVIFMFEGQLCLLMYTFEDICGLELYTFSVKSNSEYG